jgi:hypothetical protein
MTAMKPNKRPLNAFLAAGVTLTAVILGIALAQPSDTESAGSLAEKGGSSLSLGITIGDSISTVKQAFNTQANPEPFKSLGPNPRKSLLRQNTRGIWVFFNDEGLVDLIRLQRPFDAPIAAIRLGDDLAQLMEKRGKPIRQWEFGENVAYLYPLDDVLFVRYDVNKSREVETIFLMK